MNKVAYADKHNLDRPKYEHPTIFHSNHNLRPRPQQTPRLLDSRYVVDRDRISPLEESMRIAVQKYLANETKTLRQAGNYANQEEYVPSTPNHTEGQDYAPKPANGSLSKGFRRAIASLLAAAYLTTTGCAGQLKVNGVDETYAASRPDLPRVPISVNIGKKPEEFGVLTIPFYVLRPTKFLIDYPYFTDFAQEVDKAACKGGGLVRALDEAKVPNHYAQRMHRAACTDYSEMGVHNALKKMTPEQRASLPKALERILAEIINSPIKVAVREDVAYDAANQAIETKKPNYSITSSVETGIHPAARETLSFVADAVILSIAVMAATGTGPFSSGSKTRAAPTTSGGGALPPVGCPPVCG